MITRKGQHLGYKVYINDFVHVAKFPRKPGDIKGRKREHGEYGDLEYYPISVNGSVEQALEDYELWKHQGYKPYNECGNMQSCCQDWRHVCRLPRGHEGDCICDVCGMLRLSARIRNNEA